MIQTLFDLSANQAYCFFMEVKIEANINPQGGFKRNGRKIYYKMTDEDGNVVIPSRIQSPRHFQPPHPREYRKSPRASSPIINPRHPRASQIKKELERPKTSRDDYEDLEQDNTFLTSLMHDFEPVPHTKYSALNESPDDVMHVLRERSREVEAMKLNEKIQKSIDVLDKKGRMKKEKPLPELDPYQCLKDAQVLHFEYGPYYAYMSRVLDYMPPPITKRYECIQNRRNAKNSAMSQDKGKREMAAELLNEVRDLQYQVENSRLNMEKSMILLGCGQIIPWKMKEE